MKNTKGNNTKKADSFLPALRDSTIVIMVIIPYQ